MARPFEVSAGVVSLYDLRVEPIQEPRYSIPCAVSIELHIERIRRIDVSSVAL
jgi:hypothetical protein